MPAPDALLTFATASIVLFLIPGPAVADIVYRAVVDGRATAFSIVKWRRAGYLAAVGLTTLGSGAVSITRRRAFVHGVVVNTLNPKVGLFFLSFLPQFIDPDGGPAWSQSLLLGATFVLLGCIMGGLWAALADSVRRLLVRGRAQAFVRRDVSGTLLGELGHVAAALVGPERPADASAAADRRPRVLGWQECGL